MRAIFNDIALVTLMGFYIAENAIKRRKDFVGANPCGEILLTYDTELKAGSVCNLTEVNLLPFVKDSRLDWDDLEKAFYHATRMGSRITMVDMWDQGWDYIQKRDRLLGVSITGIVESFVALNIDDDIEEQNKFYAKCHSIVRNIADKYHEELNIPRSLLVSTCKPSGSVSQIPTVSSGIHAPYAPFYLRRIRVTKKDPMAKALFAIGMTPGPENGQGDDINASECNTWIFTFPVKTNAKIRAIDESAIKQLERYKAAMDHYIEHNVSITVTVAEHEWDDVANWVYNNWDSCIGIAFLPRFDPSEGFAYPNMPYETCTEEEYNKLAASINLDEEKLLNYISLFEQEYEEYELDASCGSTSACPIR